jgi:hypothetical protein
MGIREHKEEWAGKKVLRWDAQEGIQADPATTAYRIGISYDEDLEGYEGAWLERFAQYLADPRSAETTALVVGCWELDDSDTDSSSLVAALAGAVNRLPKLTSLFLGDIISEECEISWLQQSDVSPLLAAYPNLEHFGVRGTNELVLGNSPLPTLKTLVIETGAVSASVMEEVKALDLPAIEHLEIWLGTHRYEGEATAELVTDFLDGAQERWLHLKYLGLRDSDIADTVAEIVAAHPILEQLETLDLSLGILGDRGAEALAASSGVRKLNKLDVHYHYMTEESAAKLQTLGIDVDFSEPQTERSWGDGTVHRYVAVSE